MRLIWKQLGWHLAIVALLVPTLFPVYFLVAGSLKSPAQWILTFWGIPRDPMWEHLRFAVRVVAPYAMNSVIVSGATCLAVLAIGSLAAYALTQLSLRFRRQILYFVVVPMMIPGVLTLAPSFLVTRELGLLNSRTGLIVTQLAGSLPFAIFVLQAFFEQVPKDLVAASRIDGAGDVAVLRHVMFPMATPALATVAVLNLLGTWNNYVWPLVCIRDEALRTVPLGAAFAQTEFNLLFDPGREMAVYLIGSVPLLIAFVVAMRAFLRGLASGALKM